MRTNRYAHGDPSERHPYPHAAPYGDPIRVKADPIEAAIPPEKLGDYRMARGLLRVLDILAPKR